jgi:hypothetical protein
VSMTIKNASIAKSPGDLHVRDMLLGINDLHSREALAPLQTQDAPALGHAHGMETGSFRFA